MKRGVLAYVVLACLLAGVMIPEAGAAYTVTNLNVTVALGTNTSAQVTEILTVQLTNQSIRQYTTNRVALNLTLSDWQNIIGPLLVQHVMNPSSSVHNFKLLPGAIMNMSGTSAAYVLMSYTVDNVTTVNRTAPRTFAYSFNPRVFNFEHGASGQVLNENATLTITLPAGATIKSIYPLPDYPPSAFTSNYKNVTTVSWFNGEPLSKFSLTYVTTEGIQDEVTNFFMGIYDAIGAFIFVIIAAAVGAFAAYTYMKGK